MTVVNYATGEVIDLDRAAAERRAERIRLRLDAIADNYAAVMPMIREAIEKRDDAALGYRSVGEYVADRFGGALHNLGVEVRREVVRELTQAGMSTRAIAPVVGADHVTVSRDIKAGVARATPEPAEDVQNLHTPQAESAEATHSARTPEARPILTDEPDRITKLTGANSVASPGVVTGIDGKTYTRPEPKAAPRKPITDQFRDRLYDLALKAESLHRLIEDDRWAQNAEKLAAVKNRNELRRINDLLEQVANAITENEVTP